MKENPKSKENIVRIDHKYTHGWQVRVQYNYEQHGRFFSDRKYGGKQKALEKAIVERQKIWNWIDKQTPSKPTEYDTRFYYPEGQSHRKTLGIPGVYRVHKEMRSGETYPYYEATVHREKGKAVTRARSISKHGELEAFLQIARWRAEKLSEIYPERFDRESYEQKMKDYTDKIKAGELPEAIAAEKEL